MLTIAPLIRQFSRWSNCHLPRIAASPRGKAFGRPFPIKQCAAPASLLPLLRGRWRGAPDEVVDVNDRPPHPSVLPLVELPPAAASASALGGKSQAVWLFLSPRAPEGRRLLARRFQLSNAPHLPRSFPF